jgi:uncharacterized protein
MDTEFVHNGNRFVWNADKAALNVHKHGIRFEEAATAFDDPFFVLTDATRNDEARDAVIGLDAHGRLLFVVHIEIDETGIRIISARRATAREETLYAQ